MKHYKNKQGQVFGFDNDQLHLVTPDMVKMTDAEFHEFCNPKPTPEQVKQQRINELRQNLDQTEYKFNADYDRKDTQEWLELKAQRQAWRDEIRELEA